MHITRCAILSGNTYVHSIAIVIRVVQRTSGSHSSTLSKLPCNALIDFFMMKIP